MSEPAAAVYGVNGRVVAVPMRRTTDGDEFAGPPLEPLEEPVDEEALGRLAMTALDRYESGFASMEDHDRSLYAAAGVGSRAAFFRDCRAAHLEMRGPVLTVSALENLGPSEGFTWPAQEAARLADQEPLTVGRAVRRALELQSTRELERDLEVAAEWMAEALLADGYDADFSVRSARELDRFFEAQLAAPGAPVPGGRFDDDRGRRLFGLGAYLGAVLERNVGAEWHAADATGEEDVPMILPDGAMVWPIRRVIARYREGPEASLAAYVRALGTEEAPSLLRRVLRRR